MMILLALAGCGGGRDAEFPAQPIAATTGAPAPLELRLELPGRVRSGEPVAMRLVLENRGETPRTVDLGGSPIAFDLLVRTSEGADVWRRLEGVMVEAILQPRTLPPGGSLVFADRWDQRSSRGRRVPPGSYQVRGILPVAGVPGGWTTEAHTLTILW